jgi:HK97 family phage major capsid protein
MAGALQQRLDEDFVDPTVTLSAGVRPASITQGAATQAATGTGDHADIITDFKYMMGVISTQGIRRSPVLIVDSATALALGMMINTFGQKVFPDMSMSGGTFLAGVQVIVSDSVPHASAGGTAILVNAPEILIADEGGFDIAMSRDASLLMTDTDPQTDMSSVPVNGSAAMVSMFQTNSVAFRAERAIGWLRARTTAVAYVTAVNWGAA